MKIVFLDKSTVGDVPGLEQLSDFGEVRYFDTTSPDQTIERTKSADIVITNKVIIDKSVMDASGALKLICIAATGMNNVDLDQADSRGIVVKNVSGYSTLSVTQSTFAMVLALQNALPYYDQYVKSGEYSDSPIFTHLGRSFRELHNKTYGIIGMGAIGRSVAKIAEAFGCRVVYYSTSGENTDQPYPCLSLEELLQGSDVVSIHAPLNENTRNLIDLNRIKLMKKEAILINAGRGHIVHEADLAKALDDNLIAGAGIDVYSEEPTPPNNPLLKIKNNSRLILTPHVAWASIESRTLLVHRIYENIRDFMGKSSD